MVTKISATTEVTESMMSTTTESDENASDLYVDPLVKEEFVVWAIIDGLLLVAILCGNILTILAVRYSRRLRSVISNQFVLSLAISDILVGLTLPYHLAFYLNTQLGESKPFCLLRFFLVIMACCVSIWNLIAIALDRYIAICYPLHYSRYMTRKIALCLMASGWIVGFTIGAIPLIWNQFESALECEFDQIFYPWYMVGVVTPVFSLVWFTMFFVYCRIWREASKQVKQMRVTGQQEGTSDWKSVQMVLLILGCFTICWLPYFIVACSQIYRITGNSSSVAYMISFTLAMSNSAMNPVIYAWKNSNFRVAFLNLLRCKSPDTLEPSQSMRSNLHRKSSSAQHQDALSGAFPNYSTPPFMKKIEPAITAMGITFEEDEDKISTYESAVATTTTGAANNIKSKQLINANPASVTIKIESDTRNSIIISTTTLPSPTHFAQLDNSEGDERRGFCSSKDDKVVAGNLIVNKLIENYGYDGDSRDNFLNVDSCIKESSKRKSKSASSIIIAKSPNKSNSHGSIYDQNIKSCSSSNLKKNEHNASKNLMPTFHFDGKKYISRSFNSAVEGLHKCDGSDVRVHGKSTELNFPA